MVVIAYVKIVMILDVKNVFFYNSFQVLQTSMA